MRFCLGYFTLFVLLLQPAVAQDRVSSPESRIDVDALLTRGGRLLENGDVVAALEIFTQATEAAAGDQRAWLALAHARERRGDHFEALEAARRAQALDSESPLAVLAIGRLLSRIGAVDQALQSFERLRRLAPENHEGWILPALLLRDMGRHAEAIELLSAAEGVDATLLLRELALLLVSEGRAEEAAERLAPHVEVAPDHLALPWGLALASVPARRAEALPWLRRAFEAGRAEGVRDGRIALELGSLQLEAGQVDEAVETLEQAVALEPESAEAHYRLGTALGRAGDQDRAAKALERFQALSAGTDAADWDDKRIGTTLNEAQQAASQNRLDEAIGVLDQLLNERPDEFRALILKGKVLFSMGKRSEAALAMASAARLAPGLLEPHYLEGVFRLTLEELPAAEKALRRALAIDDREALAHQMLGVALLKSGRAQEAIPYFERALELDADNPELRLAWAEALASLGRDAESAVQLEAYRKFSDG